MQTTGMRGGAKKTWKMRTSDTLSFKLIVGRDFKDGAVPAVGAGLFYDESALTAWLIRTKVTLSSFCSSVCKKWLSIM